MTSGDITFNMRTDVQFLCHVSPQKHARLLHWFSESSFNLQFNLNDVFLFRFVLPSFVQYLPAKIDGATSMCWMCWLSMADTYRPELWQKRKQSFWFGIRGMVGGFYTSPACLYHLSDSGKKFMYIAIWLHNSWSLRNPENQGVLV